MESIGLSHWLLRAGLKDPPPSIPTRIMITIFTMFTGYGNNYKHTYTCALPSLFNSLSTKSTADIIFFTNSEY